jgi:4-hydroxybenzoate polyprenyltransferase
MEFFLSPLPVLVTCVLLGSGLAALNEYYDSSMDRQSLLRDSPVSRGNISGRFVLTVALLFCCAGLGLSVVIGSFLRFSLLTLIWGVYTVPPLRLKKRFPFGNIVNCASGIVLVSIGAQAAHANTATEIVLSGFGGTILLAGHCAHQAADVKSDRAAGHDTVAVRFKPAGALRMAWFSVVASIFLLTFGSLVGLISAYAAAPLIFAGFYYSWLWWRLRGKVLHHERIKSFRRRYQLAYLLAGSLSLLSDLV